MPHVNVRTAAELTGRDRSTITRAIKGGQLSATRDAHSRFLIDPAELERVFGTLGVPTDARTDARIGASHQPASNGGAQAMQVKADMLEAQLERERRERDQERQAWGDERTFLRGLVEKQTEQMRLLTDQRSADGRPATWSAWLGGLFRPR